jgi:CRISPR-associated protein Cas4
MDDYIAISTLNDFIFSPYSIYLHNVYMETDEGMYHATPQTCGRIAHETVDEKRTSNRADELQSLPVILRTRFAKMLRSQGAIRLQFSVYEVNNT